MKIDESTKSIISDYVDVIRNQEEGNEKIYPTIEVLYSGQSRPQVVVNRLLGGADAFEKKIDDLKSKRNIEAINIKFFRTADLQAAKPFMQTGLIDFYLKEPEQSRDNTKILQGYGNIETRNFEDRTRSLELRLQMQEIKMECDYKVKELEMKHQFETNNLNTQIVFLANENKEYREKISELLEKLAEHETDLNNLQARHNGILKENKQMESMGLSGFKDFDWMKGMGQIAVTAATNAVQNIAKEQFGLDGFGHVDAENIQPLKEETLEEETY